MYPNPQDALPLPPRPNAEQYRKLAKDLVKACRSGDPDAIGSWAVRWIERLAAMERDSGAFPDKRDIDERARAVAEFARTKLAGGNEPDAVCALSDAQFVIARAHGFLSWPKFISHVDSLASTSSSIAAFEAAALAIVTGDAATLTRLLREHPELIRARSTREHRATLLHYVAANGVENYRQVSPKNIAEITRILVDAGADVEAEADVYGGGCTALGLVATSEPPAAAGVQLQVIDVLLERGASMDHPGSAGNNHALIRACLANGQPDAAEYLARRGAPLDLPGAAGLGRVDELARFFDESDAPRAGATKAQMKDALALASTYGRTRAVEFLLDRGMEVDEELRGHGEGHTALHVAAFHGHADVVDLLLRRGASVHAIDKTWGTPPLLWALTGWTHRSEPDPSYYDVIARLVGAGAQVRPDAFEWEKVRADPKMLAALKAM